MERSINTRSPGEKVNLIPLSVCRLFGIPVSHGRLFTEAPDMSFAQVLPGDPLMPITAKPGWPAPANAIRNAYLAKFTWKELSVIDLGATPRQARRVMFGEGQVMPGPVLTRFIAVKHGHEDCQFAVINADGHSVPFTVIGRVLGPMIDGVIRERLAVEPSWVGIDLSAADVRPFITFV